jgi:putative PEP-CTERM system histidine kinase
MSYFPSLLSFVAAGLLLALALLHLRKARRSAQKILFIISSILLATGEIALGLLLTARNPERAMITFQIISTCTLIFPPLGISFFLTFGRSSDRITLTRYLPGLIILGFLSAAAAAAIPAQRLVREIHFLEDGFFWGMTLSGIGKGVGAYILLANIFFLYIFENTYRAANVPSKVTLKYPLLGIIAASIINFVVLSRILAISMLDRYFLTFQTCGIIIVSISFLYATLRYHLLDVQTYFGREFVSSVFTLIVSGLYLLAFALIAMAARHFGVPFDSLTFPVLGIFVVFLFLAVIISGKARKRLRRFVNENFYFNMYDYRKEWRKYARLMASSNTIDELLENVINSLCATMLAKRGIIWADIKGGRYAFYGDPDKKADTELLEQLYNLPGEESVTILPALIEGDLPSASGIEKGSVIDPEWIRVTTRLGHDNGGRGLIALGDKEMNTSYTAEDLDFLATIADQTTLTLENLQMEEKILESSRMDSFNRFASFVIHDLKNTVGMLSLTAENARDNISNREFQQDAIETINRSVEKMKGLISSLSAHRSPSSLATVETNIYDLLSETIHSMKRVADSAGVHLEFRCEHQFSARIDAPSIKRVLENIIINAIEATPVGGTVTVESEPSEEKEALITVTDNGNGFDPEYLSNYLFRPFHSTKKEGIGIGLVLCKSLVEAHGGIIQVSNRTDGGAVVKIRLPALPDSWKRLPSDQSPSAGR